MIIKVKQLLDKKDIGEAADEQAERNGPRPKRCNRCRIELVKPPSKLDFSLKI